MKFDDLAGDRQAETAARRSPPGGVFDLNELVEDYLLILRGNPHPVICDVDAERRLIYLDPDRDFAVFPVTEFDGIGEDVDHDLGQTVTVAFRPGKLSGEILDDADVFLLNQAVGRCQGVRDDLQ